MLNRLFNVHGNSVRHCGSSTDGWRNIRFHWGYNIIVFPEGTVGKEKTTLPFKKGTFMEAASNNIPVVPVAIEFQSPKDMWIKEKFVPQYFHQSSP